MPRDRRIKEGPRTDEYARFMSHVIVIDDAASCWEWAASKIKGYGQFHLQRDGWNMAISAPRYALERKLGRRLMPNMMPCHTCDNPGCVRPDHLYEGTESDNQQDKVRRGRHPESSRTHCPQGHAYDSANTYRYGNKRDCRQCIAARQRAHRHRMKENRD